jgi:hypothetical protein
VKKLFIESMSAGMDLVNEPFLLEEVSQRTTKDGRPFLLFKLRDKTGQIGGVFGTCLSIPWLRPKTGPFCWYGPGCGLSRSLAAQRTDMNPSSTTD